MSRWWIAAQQMRLDTFIRLVHAHGMTGVDAGRHAREALLDYSRTFAGQKHPTWQHAWNAMIAPHDGRTGTITISNPKCATCHGKGHAFTGNAMVKAMSRGMPQGMCPDCRGSGRGDRLRIIARVVPEPQPEQPADAADPAGTSA